jgi:hypothetical protein
VLYDNFVQPVWEAYFKLKGINFEQLGHQVLRNFFRSGIRNVGIKIIEA